MARILSVLFLVALAGCASIPPSERPSSPCDAGEASYDCQVERYNNVGEP